MTDRLAARRAAQQQGNTGYDTPTQASGNGGYQRRPNPYAQQDDRPYEMSEVRTTAASGDVYSEISSIQDEIFKFNENVKQISKLHNLSFQFTANTDAANINDDELDSLVEETRGLSSSLKRRIQSLDSKPGAPRQQVDLVKSKFIAAIQNYQTVERDYRNKNSQRIERQYKIVNPNATPDEINRVVNDPDSGQVFTQAVLNRGTKQEGAYQEVQARQGDVKRIEKTLEELAQLFNDMSVLVNQQQETIQAIETQAATVEHDTEAGLKHTNDAVKSARAARKKRWICFFIIILIIVIVAASIGGYYASQNKK